MSKLMMLVAAKWREFSSTNPHLQQDSSVESDYAPTPTTTSTKSSRSRPAAAATSAQDDEEEQDDEDEMSVPWLSIDLNLRLLTWK